MSSGSDDINIDNLGSGGVKDQSDLDFRNRLNTDLSAALEEPKFNSRRSAIMAQIRANEASPPNALGVSPTAQSHSMAPKVALTPHLNINASQNKSLENDNTPSSRVRPFFRSNWAGTLAAVLVVILVASLAIILLNNSNNSTNRSLNSNGQVASNAAAGTENSADRQAIANTLTNKPLPAAAVTSAAATTTSAPAATTNAAATTVAAASTTTTSFSGSGNSAAGVTTSAATTKSEASPRAASAAQNTQTVSSDTQTNLPQRIVNNLPVYPNAVKLNLDDYTARSFLLNLLNKETDSNLTQNISNNNLVLLSVYEVKATDLSQWYSDKISNLGFTTSSQSSTEASSQPENASISWRTYTSNSDPKQVLTYFFLNVKNRTILNNLQGQANIAEGDTIIFAFGSHS